MHRVGAARRPCDPVHDQSNMEELCVCDLNRRVCTSVTAARHAPMGKVCTARRNPVVLGGQPVPRRGRERRQHESSFSGFAALERFERQLHAYGRKIRKSSQDGVARRSLRMEVRPPLASTPRLPQLRQRSPDMHHIASRCVSMFRVEPRVVGCHILRRRG
jgi:hypothetical protein